MQAGSACWPSAQASAASRPAQPGRAQHGPAGSSPAQHSTAQHSAHRDLALTSWPRITRPAASYSTYASVACREQGRDVEKRASSARWDASPPCWSAALGCLAALLLSRAGCKCDPPSRSLAAVPSRTCSASTSSVGFSAAFPYLDRDWRRRSDHWVRRRREANAGRGRGARGPAGLSCSVLRPIRAQVQPPQSHRCHRCAAH